MAPRPGLARVHAVAAVLALSGVLAVFAGPAAAGSIYTCVDPQGRRLTADHPLAECTATVQRVLNRDGSLNRLVPVSLTAAERADQESEARRQLSALQAGQDLVRRDATLLKRYPSEAAHAKARGEALETMTAALERTDGRLKSLAAEDRALVNEAEFYVNRPLPPSLRERKDAHDASVAAQQMLRSSQQAEVARINTGYDAELARLRKLWAGAAPGSLGPL